MRVGEGKLCVPALHQASQRRGSAREEGNKGALAFAVQVKVALSVGVGKGQGREGVAELPNAV